MPVLPTAPSEENSTKPAAVPKVGACAKTLWGKQNAIMAVAMPCNNFFIWIGFELRIAVRAQYKINFVTIAMLLLFHLMDYMDILSRARSFR